MSFSQHIAQTKSEASSTGPSRLCDQLAILCDCPASCLGRCCSARCCAAWCCASALADGKCTPVCSSLDRGRPHGEQVSERCCSDGSMRLDLFLFSGRYALLIETGRTAAVAVTSGFQYSFKAVHYKCTPGAASRAPSCTRQHTAEGPV